MKANTLDKSVDLGRVGNHYTKGRSERTLVDIDAKNDTVTYENLSGVATTVSSLEWKHWKRHSTCMFRKAA